MGQAQGLAARESAAVRRSDGPAGIGWLREAGDLKDFAFVAGASVRRIFNGAGVLRQEALGFENGAVFHPEALDVIVVEVFVGPGDDVELKIAEDGAGFDGDLAQPLFVFGVRGGLFVGVWV